MSAYLKALGLHVYLATTKKSYINNHNYFEANALAVDALKHTLSKEHISLISYCFYFCSVEHIDLSQGINVEHFRGGIYWSWVRLSLLYGPRE